MFQRLHADKLISTSKAIADKVNTRFPDSGLSQVATEVLQVAEASQGITDDLKRPIWPLRIINVLLALGIAGILGYVLLQVGPSIRLHSLEAGWWHVRLRASAPARGRGRGSLRRSRPAPCCGALARTRRGEDTSARACFGPLARLPGCVRGAANHATHGASLGSSATGLAGAGAAAGALTLSPFVA